MQFLKVLQERRVPATLRWGYGRRPSAAPHRISRILSGPDVESIPPFLGFWVLRLFSPTGDGTGSFSYFSGQHEESRYRHAAFMAFFYDLYALVGNLRFSEVRVAAA